MKHLSLILLGIALIPGVVLAQTTYPVNDEASLDTALAAAVSGDTVQLTADFPVAAAAGKTVPSGVTVDGQGFTITSSGNFFFGNSGQTGVVIQDLTWTNAAANTGAWTFRALSGGDVTLNNCALFNIRMSPWDGASTININDSTLTYRLPKYSFSEFANPIILYQDGTLNIDNTLIDAGYADTASVIHVDTPIIGSFGWSAPDAYERNLNVSNCIITSPTDGDADDALSGGPRHMTVLEVSGDTSADDNFVLIDTAIIADVSGVLRINDATPTVTVENCAILGMIRSRDYLRFAADPPAWYYDAGSLPADTFNNNIEESNPYVDPLAGDWRMIETAAAATGSSVGGLIGKDFATVAADETFQNKGFEHSVEGSWSAIGTVEFFNGFDIVQATDTQGFEIGTPQTGNQSLALVALDSATATGGAAHNNTISHAVFQTFQVKPNSLVNVSVSARRSVVSTTGTTWLDNGQYGEPVIGLADGVVTDPALANTTAGFTGDENIWETENVQLVATGNEMTLFLIHRTNGSFNRSEFDDVVITVGPAPNPASVEKYELYR